MQHVNPDFKSTAFSRRMRPYQFRITATFGDVHSCQDKPFILNGELAGIRTQDPRLKRALLYQLSYELVQDRCFKTNTARHFLPPPRAAQEASAGGGD
jgi:hypothetical protein